MDDVTRNLFFFVLFNIAHVWHFGVCCLEKIISQHLVFLFFQPIKLKKYFKEVFPVVCMFFHDTTDQM